MDVRHPGQPLQLVWAAVRHADGHGRHERADDHAEAAVSKREQQPDLQVQPHELLELQVRARHRRDLHQLPRAPTRSAVSPTGRTHCASRRSTRTAPRPRSRRTCGQSTPARRRSRTHRTRRATTPRPRSASPTPRRRTRSSASLTAAATSTCTSPTSYGCPERRHAHLQRRGRRRRRSHDAGSDLHLADRHRGTRADHWCHDAGRVRQLDDADHLGHRRHPDGPDSSHSADNATVSVALYSGPTATGSPLQTVNPTVSGGGTWSVSESALAANAQYTVKVTQGDAAGNSGSATSTFVIDTVAPTPTVTAPAAYVNTTTPTISGTAGVQTGDASHSADNGTVTVKIYSGAGTGGLLLQTINNVAVSGGTWSTTAATLPPPPNTPPKSPRATSRATPAQAPAAPSTPSSSTPSTPLSP